MEFPSPTPRRIARPRWLDLRLVLGIVLVLAAVLLGVVVVARARHTDRQLAVTHDLAAGTTLRVDDVRTVDVQLSDSDAYVRDESQALGKVLTRPVSAGELLPLAALGAQPPRTTVIVPFAADAAPQLRRGQRIVVWLSTPACPDTLLLADVTVQDVRSADSGTFDTSGGGQDAVLTVTPDLADRVVAAIGIEKATIRAGVLSGAAPDPAPALPSLDGCGEPGTP